MPDPIDVYVGRKLKRRRQLLRLSLHAVAAATGISFQQISKYEKGASRLSVSVLWKLAQPLDVSMSYFFEGFEPEQDQADYPRPLERVA